MEWSPEQQRCLLAVDEFMKDPKRKLFRLFGYAGTGKTTLAKHIAHNSGGEVLFAAYTGKAAQVLHSKGCFGARTIHSLIYIPQGDALAAIERLREQIADLQSRSTLSQAEREYVEELKRIKERYEEDPNQPIFDINALSELRDARLLILDECSMVDQKTALDLLSFGTKIIALGDPFQLPPVKGTGYFINEQPDFMLTEIHRQARDNPIIQIASSIRENGFVRNGLYGESRVINSDEVVPDMFTEADQVLCATHNTRFKTIKFLRQKLGFTGRVPNKGERLICKKNNRQEGLINGGMWECLDAELISEHRVKLAIRDEEGTKLVTSIMDHFDYTIPKEINGFETMRTDRFDWAYCITGHSAQGSQWPSVLIKDDAGFMKADRPKWLYTSVTRASEKVVVVR